jgi:hypothetical protein
MIKNSKTVVYRSLRAVHWVFAAVVLLRIFVLFRLTDSPLLLPNSGDMQFYNEWAQRILKGQWTDGHAFYGLPLYAYLLAALYGAFGYTPFVPSLLQAGLEGGTAVIIYKLAVRIFGQMTGAQPRLGQPTGRWIFRYSGECIGVLAALGWGFFLPEQSYSAILMPTAGLVFVYWFVIWQIVSRREEFGFLRLLLLGILIGFTAMGIATILFLVPLILAALFVNWPRPSGARPILLSRFIGAFLLFGGIGIGTSPCWIHNYLIANDPVLLSAHSGINFWIGNNPIATGYPRFPPGLRADQKGMLVDSITEAEAAAGHPLKRSEVSSYWSAKARDYIKTNFGSWLKLVATKAGNFWNAFQYDDLSIITVLREQRVTLPGPGFGLIALFAIPGLLIAAVKAPLSRWVSLAVLLQMASLLTVFVTERYRVAAVPGLLLGASFGLWQLWQNCALGRYRELTVYGLLLLLAAWFVTRPQTDTGLWALDAYNSGWQALQTDNLALAEKKLSLAYSYVPENAEINFALGNLENAKNNKSRAKGYYASCLQLNPRHEGALNNLGVLALEESRWELAAKFFGKAIELNPNDEKTLYLLARTFFRLGDRDQARLEISRALAIDPTRTEFLKLRDEIQ